MRKSFDPVIFEEALIEGDLTRLRDQLDLEAQQTFRQINANLPRSAMPALMAAVHTGRVNTVDVLCAHGADLNFLDEQGRSALMVAVDNYQGDIVQRLLDAGADPWMRGGEKAALHQAVAQGDVAIVVALLGANRANIRPGDLHTALHEAATSGQDQVIAPLLDAGAHLDRPDSNGNTALILAAAGGHEKTVSLLLDQGANPNCADKRRRDALEHNWQSPNPSEAIAMALLRGGARVDHANANAQTSLMHCVKAQNFRSAQYLIEHGAPLGHTDHKGGTALHWAARGADVKLVALLLANGADPMDVDARGRLALHVAAESGQIQNITLLANFGGLNSTDQTGATPLNAAAALGCDDAAMALLDLGSVVGVNGTLDTVLHSAAKGGCLGLAKAMIDRGVDVNALNLVGRTALHEAAANNHCHIGAVLALAGADQFAKTPEGLTSYDLATEDFARHVHASIAQRHAEILHGKTRHAPFQTGKRRI